MFNLKTLISSTAAAAILTGAAYADGHSQGEMKDNVETAEVRVNVDSDAPYGVEIEKVDEQVDTTADANSWSLTQVRDGGEERYDTYVENQTGVEDADEVTPTYMPEQKNGDIQSYEVNYATDDMGEGDKRTVSADIETTEQSIATIAANDARFSTLVSLLSEAELVSVVDGEGAFTVFAPTNDAFAMLDESDLNTLQRDQDKLQMILKTHVIDGVYNSQGLAELRGDIRSLSGSELAIDVDDQGSVSLGEANVIAADIEAENGIIHVVNGVIIPEDFFAQTDGLTTDIR